MVHLSPYTYLYRYILSDLKYHAPTYSAMQKFCQQLPETPQPMRPQGINVTKEGFTIVLHGDEAYKATEDEPRSQVGGRHRMVVETKLDWRPRVIAIEVMRETNSKL